MRELTGPHLDQSGLEPMENSAPLCPLGWTVWDTLCMAPPRSPAGRNPVAPWGGETSWLDSPFVAALLTPPLLFPEMTYQVNYLHQSIVLGSGAGGSQAKTELFRLYSQVPKLFLFCWLLSGERCYSTGFQPWPSFPFTFLFHLLRFNQI